jgi:hypothetical protein
VAWAPIGYVFGMRRSWPLLCALFLLGGATVLSATSSASVASERSECENLEAAVRASVLEAPGIHASPEQAAADAAAAAAPCWEKVRVAEAAEAKADQEVREAEERQAREAEEQQAEPQPESRAQPKTVAQFHRLPKRERRSFALGFMTTRPVSPCRPGPLTREEALNVLRPAVEDVKPGYDAADGGRIPGDAPVGYGIRRILANIGCQGKDSLD